VQIIAGAFKSGIGDVAVDEAERARQALASIGRNIPPIDLRYRYRQEGPGPGFDPNDPGNYYALGEAPERVIGYDERRLRGYARGGMVYAARGMFVPRGTDTVPAMLTPGEYVMPKTSVDQWGAGFFERLSAGPAPVRRSETVASTPPAMAGGDTYNITIQTLDVASFDRWLRREPDAAKAVALGTFRAVRRGGEAKTTYRGLR
jgi:hypothetical protein